MTKTTVQIARIADDKAVLTVGEAAHRSRMGESVFKWISDFTPGDAVSIPPVAELNYDIPEDKQIFVTGWYAALLSVSDDALFSLVSCTGTSGTGTATEITGRIHIYSGSALTGGEHVEHVLDPPVRVRYADGARSVNIRIDANDGSAVVSCGWRGWVEDE